MPGQRTATAGFDRGWPKIPRERLTATDLFRMIDWVRDGWDDDEFQVTPRLQRLRWHLEELPDPYRMEALQHYETVTRARTVNGTPWLAALSHLRLIVRAWWIKRPAGAVRS